MNRLFFKSINYSSVNEDWRTEAEGLMIQSEDTVLCITGSGARPLDLLMQNPKKIVAIDMNPAQNCLLLLKMAAIQHLSFREYQSFLGLQAADFQCREDVFNRLRDGLDQNARNFFNANRKMIRSGVLYQGRWEKYYRRMSKLAVLLRPKLISTLFTFTDIEKQKTFLRENWDTALWRSVYQFVCHPLTSRLLLRDPAFYKYAEISAANMLYSRMNAILEKFPAGENFMISLLLRGVLPPDDLPPHLTAGGFIYIRERLNRIDVVTANLLEILGNQEYGQFTRYSLSDVPSYLPKTEFELLLAKLAESSKQGARMVIRQFLTRYEIPANLRSKFIQDENLETKLMLEDRAFAYNFIIAEVING